MATPAYGGPHFTLEQEIACVKRELGFRERVYPRWVKDGKMSQQKADYELGCMRAVLGSLQGLQVCATPQGGPDDCPT